MGTCCIHPPDFAINCVVLLEDGHVKVLGVNLAGELDRDQTWDGILYSTDGRKRFADNALVALTLMIAESRTEEMDMMVKVIVSDRAQGARQGIQRIGHSLLKRKK